MNSIPVPVRTNADHLTGKTGFGTAGRIRPAALAIAAAASLLGLAANADSPSGFRTLVQPYAASISPDYWAVPLLSAGDRVPLAGDPTKEFQMVGVPDGLGAYPTHGGGAIILMNHEVAGTALSEPIVGAPRLRGAFVSQFTLNRSAEVESGELAYDVIVDTEHGLALPVARVDNTTPAFVRFCSGTLAWLDAGFDRPTYLCGEENPAPATFDGKGGLAVAIFDQELHTLPHLGRFQHENVPVRPHPVPETVLVLMEDNGTGFDSQLYLYYGEKDFSRNASPLRRNGLIGGRFFVFVSTVPGVANEAAFQSGSITGQWVELAGVAGMTEAQLEAASDAVGAFGMAKAEDGAWDKDYKNVFYFNTTGDGLNAPAVVGNHLGRTYRLDFNEQDITGPCTLTILYNADQIVASGGDIALTPDNLAVGKDCIMVCEDGTGFARNVMANKGRDGLIWRYDLKNNYAATPVVSLAAPGRDGLPVGPGVWETSGIIDAQHLFGRDTWLFNVQAHPPTTAPRPGTLEDGQLMLLLPAGQ